MFFLALINVCNIVLHPEIDFASKQIQEVKVRFFVKMELLEDIIVLPIEGEDFAILVQNQNFFFLRNCDPISDLPCRIFSNYVNLNLWAIGNSDQVIDDFLWHRRQSIAAHGDTKFMVLDILEGFVAQQHAHSVQVRQDESALRIY